MSAESKYLTVATAEYTLPDGRVWTARLCQWQAGRKAGLYFAYYALPRQVGSPLKRRPSCSTRNEAEARAVFDALVKKAIPDEVRAAWEGVGTDAVLDSGDPSLHELSEWYTSVYQQARGDAEITRYNTKRIADQFADWCQGQGIHTAADLGQRPRVIDAYTAHLQALPPRNRPGPRSPETIRRDLVILRGLFRAAVERQLIAAEPVRRWPLPRITAKRYEDAPEPEQIRALIGRLAKVEVRNRPSPYYEAIRFMAHVGCRPSDVCRLKKEQVLLDAPGGPVAMILQVKTRHLVAVALAPGAVRAIEDFRARGYESEYVFCHPSGAPLRPAALEHNLRHHAQALGLNLTAKSLRQAVVSWLLHEGADQEHIRRITGHKSGAIGAYIRLKRGAAHDLAGEVGRMLDPPKQGEGA